MGWKLEIAELDDIPDVSAASPVEGDMLYRNDSGLWVVVGGTKSEGRVPVIQADGTVGWEAQSGGGGGGVRTEIDSQTLASDQTTITFSSIPDTHDDLLVVFDGVRSNRNADGSLAFARVGVGTADSGSNYAWAGRGSGGSGGDFSSGTASTFDLGGGTNHRWVPAATATAAFVGMGELWFPNYTRSGYRLMRADVFGTHGTIQKYNYLAGQWQTTETDPIDIIELTTEDDWASGSTFILYGISW